MCCWHRVGLRVATGRHSKSRASCCSYPNRDFCGFVAGLGNGSFGYDKARVVWEMGKARRATQDFSMRRVANEFVCNLCLRKFATYV
jgi:hypothetical protein